ncbi:hypothetical protein F5Y12DRAFT_736992 [Xylaria sp. FL1777]|nr:hypothetical protein F5Y12DRAFT_736992 [Xylaria sp. FL1777]
MDITAISSQASSVTPSHGPRFAQLRQLIYGHDRLSREEIRYLKHLISNSTDLIGELPLEIVVLVALELEAEEFLNCLHVSKVWRERFLSDPIRAAYAKSHWPALIDVAVNRSSFLRALSKIARQQCVNGPRPYKFVAWDKKAHSVELSSRCDRIQLDPIFHNLSSNVPDAYTQYDMDEMDGMDEPYRKIPTALYSSGKVAWHLCSCVIVIDDLTLKTRKILTPPSGIMYGSLLKLQALGSRLVVGSIDRLLIAWDHVNNQAYEKLLPSRILRCTTQDDRVAIILHGGDIVIWTLGREVLQLDISPLALEAPLDSPQAETWATSLYVFFDARDRNILYLVSGFYFRGVNSTDMVRVTVHEFTVTGHVASWSSEFRDRTAQWACEVEPCIVISEYEAERSCIIFRRHGMPCPDMYLITFDKLKRKFVEQGPQSSGPHSLRRRLGLMVKGGVDVDFLVSFGFQGYEVIDWGRSLE